MLICSEGRKKKPQRWGGGECMWMCSLIQRIKMALFLQCFSRLQAAKTNMFTILALTQCEWQHLSCGWQLNLLRMVQRNPCRRNLIIKKFTTHCSLDLPNSRRTVLFILSCRQSRDASECFKKKKNHFTVCSHLQRLIKSGSRPAELRQIGGSPSHETCPLGQWSLVFLSFAGGTFWRGIPVEMNEKHSLFLMTLTERQLQQTYREQAN